MLETAFWEGSMLMPCRRFFNNEYGTYDYAVKAAENMLSESHKTAYLFSQSLQQVMMVRVNIEHPVFIDRKSWFDTI
jgi:hypothetical protein